MPGYFKISRPNGSDRTFCFGFSLKGDEFFYIDDPTVARNFQVNGWTSEPVDGKPTDGDIHQLAKTESFQHLMSELKRRESVTPKGKWECTAPKGFARVFCFGDDTRHPVVTEDHDKMLKFQDLGFTIKDVEKKEPVAESDTNEKIEGAEAPKPKGGISTYTPKGRANG